MSDSRAIIEAARHQAYMAVNTAMVERNWLFGKRIAEEELKGKKSILLTWTHYRTLLQVDNDEAREWYARETAKEMWSVRTLQRNISSQYYFRLLQSQHKDLVEKEMKALTAPLQGDKLEFI